MELILFSINMPTKMNYTPPWPTNKLEDKTITIKKWLVLHMLELTLTMREFLTTPAKKKLFG